MCATNTVGGLLPSRYPECSRRGHGQAIRKRNLGRIAFAVIATALLICSTASAQFDPNQEATDVSFCPVGTNIIVGTEADDVLIGSNGADCILGLGGNDTIRGRRGNDFIIGGDGNDNINGGRGDDTIFGNAGADVVNGGSGSDAIFGGAGNDRLRGGRDGDQIYGQGGNDVVSGGSGADALDGGDGDDRISGGRGNDVLLGGSGDDRLGGGSGSDFLLGGDGTDRVNGGRGTDTCDGNACRGDDPQALRPSGLLVSATNDRSGETILGGSTVRGNIYAFVLDNSIERVNFFFNDPAMNGQPVLVDTAAPFDYCGTNHSNGLAYPFPTARFAQNGPNTFTAQIIHHDGSVEVITSVFTVDN
jgi:hypothetical protein